MDDGRGALLEPTTQLGVGSATGGSDGPVTSNMYPESDVIAHNTPYVGSLLRPLVPALTLVLLLGCSTFPTEGHQYYIRIGTSPGCGGGGKTHRRDRFRELTLG